jgi:hypothetical protein
MQETTQRPERALIYKNPHWKGFRKSPTDVILVADLGETGLIRKYRGCGTGYAVCVKDGEKWYVTDFYYTGEFMKPLEEGQMLLPCEMSCTQVCFCEGQFDYFKFIYSDVKLYTNSKTE